MSPFNASWRESVAIVTLGAGAFLAIAIAWFMVRKERSIEADLYLGTGALLVAGALVWGARLGDFNMFHLFFAGIAVFATPAAAVAVWSIWLRLRATRPRALAIVVLVLCVTQLEFGAALGVVRLQAFGPHDTRRSRRRSWPRSGASRRTPSSPTPASRRRSSPSGTHDSSASTPTPGGGSCRCASRPTPSAS